MAVTGGISLGDAVFSVLVDLTTANASLDKFGSELPSKLKPSQDAVDKLSGNFDAAGAAAQTASSQIAESVQAPTVKIQALESEIVKLKAQLQDAGKQSGAGFAALQLQIKDLEAEITGLNAKLKSVAPAAKEGFGEAAATVGLLGEATGVTLPRHVRSFLAELPGIGAALNAAFAATAVLFLIDAVVQAGEKLDEFEKKPQAIEDAWRDVGDATAAAGRTMEESLTSAQAKIIGLTQGPLAEMDYQIQHIGSDSEKVAGLVGSIGTALVTALQQQDTSKFNLLSFFIPNSREVTEQAQRFVAQLQSVLVQSGNQAGLVSLKAQLQGIDDDIKKTGNDFAQNAAKIGSALDIITGRPAEAQADVFQARLDSLNKYKASLLDLQNIVQKGIELDAANKQAAADEKQREAGSLAAEQAKRDLDSQIAGIQQRAAAEHAAFVSGDEDAANFKVSQINAIDATTAAHEQYLAKLVSIYSASGDVVKAQGVAQELATAKTQDATKQLESLSAATEKYHDETLKIVKDWEDLQNKSVAKSFEEAQQAAVRLTQTELELARAQEQVAQAQQSKDYSAQEQAIERLAAFGILTEEQKAAKLSQLYLQEENEALDALQQLLAKEQAAITAGQARLLDAQTSGDRAKVEEAQSSLNKLEAEFEQTYAKLLSTQTSYDQKSISLQIQLVRSATTSWEGFFRALTSGSLGAGNAIKAMGSLIAQGIGASVTAAVGGSQSFGQALEQLVKSTLASLAGIAVGHVLTEIAKAASDFATAATLAADPFTAGLAPGFIASAHAHLAAAAEWGVIGAGAAVAGAAIPSGSSSSSSSSGSSGSTSAATAPNPAQTPTQQPVSVVNTPKLYSGGLLTRRTVATVGDAPSGGDSRKGEGIIPLDDDRAMDAIAGEIAKRIPGGGGDTHIHIKGDVIDYSKAMQKISQHTKKGKGRLTVNNSFRVTRRG